MTHEPNHLTFNFLSDGPVTEDSFGSHARVAESIATKVEDDVPGMTIGLEGTWGSGKSSIVRMLEERWKDKAGIEVFTFDAWVHEGAPLRRTFLEELVSFLGDDKRKWIDRERWQTEVDHLTKRVQETKTKSSPQITGWTIAFAISWLLVPVGLAAIRFMGNTNGLAWLAWFTLAVLSPLAVFLGAVFWEWVSPRLPLECCKRRKPQDRLLHLARLFIRTHTTETTSTASQGIEPTSIEFQRRYDEILKEAFSEPDRQLVMVIDNLDRVGPDDALKIWATMKPFVESASTITTATLWVVVPYDPVAIEQLWADREGGGDGLARAFKEKTFQIRYRVSPPLASKWESYFKKCLSMAMPDTTDTERDAMYTVFRVKALPAYGRGIPTPREMKVFINRAVALAQQNYPKVPLPEIALYAALELADEGLLDNLAEGKPERSEFLADILDSDWRRCLAAIHYGVKPERAEEVLFTPKLRQVLRDGDADKMTSLLAKSGAAECCRTFLQTRAHDYGFQEVLIASKAFAKCTSNACWHVKAAMRHLAIRLAAVKDEDWWPNAGLSQDNAQDLVRLLSCDPSISGAVTKKLGIRVPDAAKPDEIAAGVEDWARGVGIVLTHLASETKEFKGIEVRFPDPGMYLSALRAMDDGSNGRQAMKHFMPAKNVRDGYRDHILEEVTAGAMQKGDVRIMSALLGMQCWESKDIAVKVANAVHNAIAKDGVAHDVLARALAFGLSQDSNVPASSAMSDMLKKYAKSPHICVALQAHHRQPPCAGLLITLLMLHNPAPNFPDGEPAGQGKQQYQNILAGSNQKMAAAMAKTVIAHGLCGQFLDAVADDAFADKPLVKLVIEAISQQDSTAQAMDSAAFLKHHDMLLAMLDEEGDGASPSAYESLVGRLLRKEDGSLLAAIEGNGLSLDMMRPCYLAINADDVNTDTLEGNLREHFEKDVSEDEWFRELSDESWSLRVMLVLQQKAEGLALAHRYSSGVLRHATGMRDGTVQMENDYLLGKWPRLLECIAPHEREPFRRRMLDEVVGGGEKLLTPLLGPYGEEIGNALEWRYQEADKKGKRDLEAKLVRLADHNDSVSQTWLLRLLLRKFQAVKMKGENIRCLRERLGEMVLAVLENGSDDSSGEQSEHCITRDEATKLVEFLGLAIGQGAAESVREADEAKGTD
mgnify:CR=1 FL=1